jgi:hypothetical protein
LGNLSLGQSTENPFELRTRLPETTAVAPVSPTSKVLTGNPFELRPRLASPAPAPPPAVRVALRPETETVTPAATNAKGASAIGGPLFLYQGGLLLLTTLLLIVSQRYVSRILRSLWNEEMMRSLYRDRTSGAFGRFLAGYGIYLLSLSLFVFLLARHAGWLTGDRFWGPVGQITLVVAGLIGLRHFALAALGHIFPLWKEASRYSFGIMILNIAVGLALIPANLLVAYVPPELTSGFVYGGLAILAAGYLLRALWGLRIAQPYLFSRFFHFFLYLCAVEIAPVVVLYKLFTNGL